MRGVDDGSGDQEINLPFIDGDHGRSGRESDVIGVPVSVKIRVEKDVRLQARFRVHAQIAEVPAVAGIVGKGDFNEPTGGVFIARIQSIDIAGVISGHSPFVATEHHVAVVVRDVVVMVLAPSVVVVHDVDAVADVHRNGE